MSSSSRDAQLDRFRQGFQEEARELLVELESTLLALDDAHTDLDLVSQAFRALHTIKGSGAMFGFTELAAFTHHLETAFDEVRNSRLEVSSRLIELALSALDQMKSMLESGGPAQDQPACEAILAHLRDLTGLHSPTQPLPLPIASPSIPEPSGEAEWRILFAPGPDLLRNGSDPIALLRELAGLGTLTVTADTTAIPPLADLDPERCYISWQLHLATSASADDIADVFMFAEGLCDLAIEPIKVEALTSTASPQLTTFVRRTDDRADSASIRVPTPRLDEYVNLVGELVTVQARLAQIASRVDDPDVASISEEVERLTSALRENSMSIRMLPIRATFERFRRLVHDLARDLHKEVDLQLEGAETELDKTVIDQLADPLMHLIRNSMDHGIESSATRAAAGKPPVATLRLSARHSGASVLILVSDDGGGISSEAVRQRAIARGLIAPEAQLSESQVFALILEPGFSTAQTVTDVSGRGVGMDVVRQRVEALRGSIHIESTAGQGTTVTLRLPLTLAIIDGLLVRVGEAFFILPLAQSLECIELTRHDIAAANGKHVAHLRGELIPYIRLRDYFHIREPRPEREQIMIAETEQGRCGFVVDEVLGDHQTVIKNLGHFYRHIQFISGATILGDGTVALILDLNRVVHDALRSTPTLNNSARPIAASVITAADVAHMPLVSPQLQ
ncbi:MAG: chemotaxis protein CheA [Acidobacteriota bacterium]